MKTISVRVTGKVQGVFYRKAARSEAARLNLTGWVRNEDDGAVAMEVSGDETILNRFLEWCKEGPDRAVVTEVISSELPYHEYREFTIER